MSTLLRDDRRVAPAVLDPESLGQFPRLAKAVGSAIRSGCLAPAGQRRLVGLLELAVPPGDRRLLAKAIEVFLALAAQLLIADAIAYLAARGLEALHGRIGPRFELENLIATLCPEHTGDVTDAHRGQQIAQLRCQLVGVNRSDQPAVRL